MANNLKYSRLGGSSATFENMIQRFGVVTVMNAKVYEADVSDYNEQNAGEILKTFESKTVLCELDTLKVANITQEGPTKTITGGQYANPLIKFGKSARLEIQDALGSYQALDMLCGTVSEGATMEANASLPESIHAIHVTEDFNGPKTIIGDTFFLDNKGNQVPVKIIFYQFLPDSVFNLTQDAEGDATVFDMNGDLLTTNILVSTKEGDKSVSHGVFYSIIDPNENGQDA